MFEAAVLFCSRAICCQALVQPADKPLARRLKVALSINEKAAMLMQPAGGFDTPSGSQSAKVPEVLVGDDVGVHPPGPFS